MAGLKSLGCPLNSHCVGSLENGFGKPSGYLSAATFCQWAKSKGTWTKNSSVTLNFWFNLRTSMLKLLEEQKAQMAGKSFWFFGTITATLLS